MYIYIIYIYYIVYSLLHLMHAIAHAHTSTLATSLIRAKDSMRHLCL